MLHEAEWDEIYVGRLAPRAAGERLRQTTAVDEDDGLVGAEAAEIHVRAAGEKSGGAAILLGRPRGGVAVEHLALQKFIEVHDAAARDLVAVVDGVGNRVVLRARQIEVIAGGAGAGAGFAAVEWIFARGTVAHEERRERGRISRGLEVLGFEALSFIRSHDDARNIQRAETLRVRHEAIGARCDAAKLKLTLRTAHRHVPRGREREARP